jgi:hypothetical protein
MKKPGSISRALISILIALSMLSGNCKKPDEPLKYAHGTFPDSIINLRDINSLYDDYNMALPQITDQLPVIFSSNRKSSGGQFDIEQGSISYVFDQNSGKFNIYSEITKDPFLTNLIAKAVTSGNDLGPYRLFSTDDGYEYLILSSVNEAGNLDLFYLKNQPASGTNIPEISNSAPVTLINTGSDDAYFTINTRQDTACFTSDKSGNFDIFYLKKPAGKSLSSWLSSPYEIPVRADSLNSQSNDKCPFILKKVLIFASDGPGGYGGFDLYYSTFENGKWSSGINLGPGINTSSNEYRPVAGYNAEFTNEFVIFSSDRPGGKGGYDLYFSGFDFPL